MQSLVCETAPEEADTAFQRALEASQSKQAKPVEAYGTDGISLTTARRKVRGWRIRLYTMPHSVRAAHGTCVCLQGLMSCALRHACLA